jgi:hypothetical protein
MPFSQALADSNLNWLRGQAFPSEPATLYISIHSANPGPAGLLADETAAVVSTRGVISSSDFSAPAQSLQSGGGREISNLVPVLLSSGALGAATLTHFGVWNSASGGLFLNYGLLSPPVSVVNGDVVKFDPGQLRIRALT